MNDQDFTVLAAELLEDADDQEEEKKLIGGLSERFLIQTKRTLGPYAIPFFEFYNTAWRVAEGVSSIPEKGLLFEFKFVTRKIQPILNKRLGIQISDVNNIIQDAITDVRPYIERIATNPTIARRVGLTLSKMYEQLGSFLGYSLGRFPGRPPIGWPILRKLSSKEKDLEKLKATNPGLYQSIVDRKTEIEKTRNGIIGHLEGNGWTVSRQRVLGSPEIIASDPRTGEKWVHTLDGRILSIETREKELQAKEESRKKSTRIFPGGLPTEKDPGLSLEGIRSVDPNKIEEFIPAGQTSRWVALTDSQVQDPGTRIYAVKRDKNGKDIVTEGRFKGIYMDDLVNRTGRLIEGAAFDFDAMGKRIPFETRGETGEINITVRKEPYVTIDSRGRLMVKCPYKGGRGVDPFTGPRNHLARLSRAIPTIQYEEGTNKTTYTFEPKDFPAVRSALGGMCLSGAASDMIKAFFDKLSRQERAQDQENLKHYTKTRIGGFKIEEVLDDKGQPYDPPRYHPELFAKQRQGLAWLESRGYSGVCALDTGVGKTSVAIATAQKMTRDGLAEPGSRFLYVCPAALKGNFSKEAKLWLLEKEDILNDEGNTVTTHPAQDLLDRVDVISYTEFSRRRSEDASFGENPPYAAVFFDEAQALKKHTSSSAKAVTSLKHPRKILLTASPMETNPDEMYTLVAVAQGRDMEDPEEVRELERFRTRFMLRIGGRSMGLKKPTDEDPTVQEDFKTWVKSNLYHAKKTDVVEMPLPELNRDVRALTMEPAVEAEYRKVTEGISKVLAGLITRYRDLKDVPGADLKKLVTSFRFKLAPELAKLNALANFPEESIPGSRSPKVSASLDIIGEKIGSQGRVLLFTDSLEMARLTIQKVSSAFPGVTHAVALANAIEIWSKGQKIRSYTQKSYTDSTGKATKPKEWKVFVLQEYVNKDSNVKTCILTKSYVLGQNMQAFSTVIHLDRDNFNSETMKQRTARAWRTGQGTPVEEVTLDVTYSSTKDDKDATMDEIRRVMQEMEERFFEEVVGGSQAAAIGTEWGEMGVASADFFAVNRNLTELALSPTPSKVAKIAEDDILKHDPGFHSFMDERNQDALTYQMKEDAIQSGARGMPDMNFLMGQGRPDDLETMWGPTL